MAERGYRAAMTASEARAARRRPPTRASGLLLGLGLGGFVDGIVLHQVLQWHHMVSHVEDYPVTTVAGLEVNTLADGLFHARHLGAGAGRDAECRGGLAARPPRPELVVPLGLLLAGWGIFNLVEGIVDHHLLEVHHVRDDLGGPLSWDLGFLAFGLLLVVGGWALHRRGRPATYAESPPP